MKTKEITRIVHNHYPKNLIHSLDIEVSDINHQLDKIIITFKEEDEETLSLNPLGNLLSDLQDYTMQDNYGDITEISINIDLQGNYHGPVFTFDVNIDS